MSMRNFLFISLCLLSYGCAPIGVNKELEGTGLSFACAAGDVKADEAIVWLRAKGKANVTVHYGMEPNLTKFSTTNPVKVTDDTDFTAKIVVNGLQPKTTYYYRGSVVGRRSGPICKFVTAPRMDDPADVQFAFGADTRETFKPFRIMDSIRAMRPDFFLHLGDTIYADLDGAASKLHQFWAKYRANRNDLPTQRLFSETSLYVTWDDHEVTNNFDAQEPLIPIGRKAFFDYWPIRQDSRDPKRIYRSFRWGKAAEIFILDARQYRDMDEGTMLGSEQKQWLLEALSSSDAWFKFIATPVPISGRNPDKWGGFPEERDEVLEFIEDNEIKGVVFLAADIHLAGVRRVWYRSRFKDFIVGPLATNMNRTVEGRSRRWEFFYKDSFNYGFVRVHATTSPPYAEIEILDEDNKLLYRTRIESSS